MLVRHNLLWFMLTLQEAVDYLTWTYYFRRILKNPTYYHLEGTGNEELNSFLSELVEESISTLENSGCVSTEGDMVQPTPLGQVSVRNSRIFTSSTPVLEQHREEYKFVCACGWPAIKCCMQDFQNFHILMTIYFICIIKYCRSHRSST